MWLWNWLGDALGGETRRLRRLQREVVLLQEQYRRVHSELEQIKAQRAALQRRLDAARDADAARLVGDELAKVDSLERKLRSQWDQVEIEKARLQAAIDTARTTVGARRAEELSRLSDGAAAVETERARAELALSEAQQATERTRRAADATIAEAREQVRESGPLPSQPHVEQWKASRQQQPAKQPDKEPPIKS